MKDIYILKLMKMLSKCINKIPLSLFQGIKNKAAYIDIHEHLNSRDDPVVIGEVFNYEGKMLDKKYFMSCTVFTDGELYIDCGEIDPWEAADNYIQGLLENGAVIRNSYRIG